MEKSFGKLFASLILVAIVGTGCASRSVARAKRVASAPKQDVAGAAGAKTTVDLYWSEDGHQFTTFMIAKLAGYNNEDALRLTYFSQYPDFDHRYSAVYVSIVYSFLPWDWDWRTDITQELHSLHGGHNAEVQYRRAYLAKLVSAKARRGDAEALRDAGLIIHALGDSFAHTDGRFLSGEEEAYGTFVGHGLVGHKPDEVAHADVFPKYEAYARLLYSVLARAKNPESEQLLDRIMNDLRNFVCVEEGECNARQIKAMGDRIIAWSKFIGQFKEEDYAKLEKTLRLTRDEVQSVLDEIKRGP